MLPKFSYVRAGSKQEALDQLSGAADRVHAGGTDLLGCLRDGILPTEKVVSISAAGELHGIRRSTDGGLAIGALTTIREVAESDLVRELYPGLSQAALSVASPQLRSQGTVGGNLCQRPRCWYYRGEFHCLKKGGGMCYAADGENRYHAIFGGDPCYIVHPSDTAPMLLALGAKVRIEGHGEGRFLPLDSFFVLPEEDVERETVLEPGELLTEVVLPAAAQGIKSSYRKVRERSAWDFALASVALALQMSGDRVLAGRVVLGGVAPIPWRSEAAEAALVGRTLDAAAARAAAEAAVEGAEPLAQNGFKVPLVRGIVEESLLAI
jgi:xanthine dehydrogenase YagS FAD-binding subunit